jgi:hypothetical protein
MVRETLDWMVETVGIEVIVVDVKFPLQSSEQLMESVRAALEAHPDIRLCIFSHISSMVRSLSLSACLPTTSLPSLHSLP